MAKKHVVYLIRSKDFVKIGYTSDLDKRMRDMQTGSPHKLFLITAFPMQSEAQGKAFEKNLHYICRKGRYRGEWFHLRYVQRMMKDDEAVQRELVCGSK